MRIGTVLLELAVVIFILTVGLSSMPTVEEIFAFETDFTSYYG